MVFIETENTGEAGFGEENQAFFFGQVKIKGPFRHPCRDGK